MSKIMESAKRAAEVVARWSKSKQEWADRIVSRPPAASKEGEA